MGKIEVQGDKRKKQKKENVGIFLVLRRKTGVSSPAWRDAGHKLQSKKGGGSLSGDGGLPGKRAGNPAGLLDRRGPAAMNVFFSEHGGGKALFLTFFAEKDLH